ncbi:MAG TPA: M2 family metallopeptidase, partial [Candidatus Limnocylindrales bacterium]|nr:M2 family metallopeptidase [Candidatus Limnocylindrales bacterium]
MKTIRPSSGSGRAMNFGRRIFRANLICVYLCSSVVAFSIFSPGGIMTIHAGSAFNAAGAPQPTANASSPTIEEARLFIEAAETRLLDLAIKAQRAQWVYETFITDDTEAIAAQADQAVKDATVELAAQARRFEG